MPKWKIIKSDRKCEEQNVFRFGISNRMKANQTHRRCSWTTDDTHTHIHPLTPHSILTSLATINSFILHPYGVSDTHTHRVKAAHRQSPSASSNPPLPPSARLPLGACGLGQHIHTQKPSAIPFQRPNPTQHTTQHTSKSENRLTTNDDDRHALRLMLWRVYEMVFALIHGSRHMCVCKVLINNIYNETAEEVIEATDDEGQGLGPLPSQMMMMCVILLCVLPPGLRMAAKISGRNIRGTMCVCVCVWTLDWSPPSPHRLYREREGLCGRRWSITIFRKVATTDRDR